MGTNPTKAAGSIYCQCRKRAATINERLNSRLGAAEELGYAPSTIAGWELGTDRPTPEAVMMMQEIYKAPELKNYYCKNVCPLGGEIEELTVCELDSITIKMLVSLERISDMKEQLLEFETNEIRSEENVPMIENIIQNLESLSNVAQNLKCWAKTQLE